MFALQKNILGMILDKRQLQHMLCHTHGFLIT